MAPNVGDDEDDKVGDDQKAVKLAMWVQALKNKGVSSFVWSREKKKEASWWVTLVVEYGYSIPRYPMNPTQMLW